jgi:hypothetical protein
MNSQPPTPTSAISRPAPGEVRHLFFGAAALLAVAGVVALWDPHPSNHSRTVHAAVFGILLVLLVAAGLLDYQRGRLTDRFAALPPVPSNPKTWMRATVVLSVAVVVAVVFTVIAIRDPDSHVTRLASYAVLVGLLTLLLRIAFHSWDGRIPDRQPLGASGPSTRVLQVGDFVVTLGFVAMLAVLIAFPRVHSRDQKAAACQDSIEKVQKNQSKIIAESKKLSEEYATHKITPQEYTAKLQQLSSRTPFVNCQRTPIRTPPVRTTTPTTRPKP